MLDVYNYTINIVVLSTSVMTLYKKDLFEVLRSH